MRWKLYLQEGKDEVHYFSNCSSVYTISSRTQGRVVPVEMMRVDFSSGCPGIGQGLLFDSTQGIEIRR